MQVNYFFLLIFRFDHTKLKSRDQLDDFFDQNFDFLADFYKQGTLKRLLYPFHDYLKRKGKKNPNLLKEKKIELQVPEPDEIPLEDTLNVTYDPNKSPNKGLFQQKGVTQETPQILQMLYPPQFTPQSFIPYQNFPQMMNNPPQMLQNPVHNIQNVHNQQIFISPQPNQTQDMMFQNTHQNPGMMYNPNMFFYPHFQHMYNPMSMGYYIHPHTQQQHLYTQNQPKMQEEIIKEVKVEKESKKEKKEVDRKFKKNHKKEKKKKRYLRSRSREKDSIKSKKKRRERSKDRKKKRRKRRRDSSSRSKSSKKSTKSSKTHKEKILNLLKKVEPPIEKKPIKVKPLLKPDDPRRATLPSSSSSEEEKPEIILKKENRVEKNNENIKKNIIDTKVKTEKDSKEVPNQNSEAKRRNLLDKKFMLLFDKNFQEDRKKVEAVKEEIKKEELRYKKKQRKDGGIDKPVGNIGKELDISEESSEEENNKFSDEEEMPDFPHLID